MSNLHRHFFCERWWRWVNVFRRVGQPFVESLCEKFPMFQTICPPRNKMLNTQEMLVLAFGYIAFATTTTRIFFFLFFPRSFGDEGRGWRKTFLGRLWKTSCGNPNEGAQGAQTNSWGSRLLEKQVLQTEVHHAGCIRRWRQQRQTVIVRVMQRLFPLRWQRW